MYGNFKDIFREIEAIDGFEFFSKILIRFEGIFKDIEAFFVNNVRLFQRLRGFSNTLLVDLVLKSCEALFSNVRHFERL
jgi:hypothetical protein